MAAVWTEKKLLVVISTKGKLNLALEPTNPSPTGPDMTTTALESTTRTICMTGPV